ncbi:AraC family transcriptional regulator [Lentisphaera profundi]|uniref:AraC family transcriptional regulator n=1 Tax=Lentisphaera profundi TaxID=1658616 RepID=A0ABY7VWR0_9BACT|nr:AraC family transcriptional regulator [Lentisphaera profundi]WDE98675.1 AraC family transcriptional regulator [Lentisphaera profundi]
MNTLLRYGIRANDKPCLHPLIAVLGMREITKLIEDAISPHSMPFYQLIYVDEGELDWWVNGQFYHLSPGDMILVKPYEIQTSLKGQIVPGKRFFMQINLYEQHENEGLSSEERLKVNHLFKNFIPRVISTEKNMRDIFHKLLNAHAQDGELNSIYVKSQLLEFFYLLDLSQKQQLKQRHIKQSEALNIIQTVDTFLNDNLDKVISIRELADLLTLSEVHFRRKFSAAHGLSPLKYINNKKCHEARRLLSESTLSISAIAQNLAFSSSQHLSTSFSKTFSLSPSEYRKEVKNAHEKQPLSKVSDVAARIAAQFSPKA